LRRSPKGTTPAVSFPLESFSSLRMRARAGACPQTNHLLFLSPDSPRSIKRVAGIMVRRFAASLGAFQGHDLARAASGGGSRAAWPDASVLALQTQSSGRFGEESSITGCHFFCFSGLRSLRVAACAERRSALLYFLPFFIWRINSPMALTRFLMRSSVC
jgi:hypothetical protein